MAVRLSPSKIGRERDLLPQPDSRYRSGEKATNVPKTGVDRHTSSCDNFAENKDESLSDPT
jgi:hypothetical protein